MTVVQTQPAVLPCRRCVEFARVSGPSTPVRRCWTRLLARAARLLAGWTMLLVGLVLLVIPGPGTLLSLGGLSLLSREHEWARRWVVPWENRVRLQLRRSVSSAGHLLATSGVIALTIGLAVLWIAQPAAPSWWPTSVWWLPGGVVMGVGFCTSALAMIATTGLTLRAVTREP